MPTYHFDFLDNDIQAVDCLIQYFYRQDYQSNYQSLVAKAGQSNDFKGEASTSQGHDNVDDSHPVFHAKVYTLAEYYDVPTLKELALDNFTRIIMRDDLDTERLLASVEEAYTSTVQEDRGLCDAITEFFCTHFNLLDEERVRDMLRATDSLSYDMVMY